jgi:S-adenosylmethionine hydrolase
MIITLLTDFGIADYFVGAMKGAILSVNPQAQIVDLTHEIPPHDIEAGAFTLLASYQSFPPQTIHVAVVDPGVGSQRRPLLVSGGGRFFVGPDNGLFSYIYEREKMVRVFHLVHEEFFRKPVSDTFHGRDLFAPVAGALSKGVRYSELGEEIKDYVKLAPLAPLRLGEGKLEARVIHIDRFGNCITNLTRADLTEKMIARGARLRVKGQEVASFRRFFAEGETAEQLFAIWGSAGFLEIAANQASAAQFLDVQRNHTIEVIYQT